MFAFPDPPRYTMAASLSCYLKDDRVILVFPALTLEGETVWKDIKHRVRMNLASMTLYSSSLNYHDQGNGMREYYLRKGRSTACKTTWDLIHEGK